MLNEKLILLSNNKGLSILIDDKEGITISSALKVDICSDSSVEIAGAGGIEPNLPKLLYIGFKLIPQIPYKIGV